MHLPAWESHCRSKLNKILLTYRTLSKLPPIAILKMTWVLRWCDLSFSGIRGSLQVVGWAGERLILWQAKGE